MGGSGSGFNGTRRLTVEEALALDCDFWNLSRYDRPGYTQSFHCTWRSMDSEVVVWAKIVTDDRGFHTFATFEAQGRALGRPTIEKVGVGMVSKKSNLGIGERWFWLCPGCGRERKRLYLRPDSFRPKCRECQRLGYASDRENHRPRRLLDFLGFGMGWDAQWAEEGRELENERKREQRHAKRLEYRRIKYLQLGKRDRQRLEAQPD